MTRNPNRMQEAADRLMAVFKTEAAVTVSYARGAEIIAGLSAAVGKTAFNIMQGEVMITVEVRDYMFDKADLVMNGAALAPASGDRITEADGRIFEVSAPKPFNVYENLGPDGAAVKIHTTGPKS